MKYETFRNEDYGSHRDLAENSESFGLEGGRKCVDISYSGCERQRELCASKKKTLLFEMLKTHFPENKRRSSPTFMREFINRFSFWTAKIETHSDKIDVLMRICDKRV